MGLLSWTILIFAVLVSGTLMALAIRHGKKEEAAREQKREQLRYFEETKARIAEAKERAAETGEPQVTAVQGGPVDSASFFASSDEAPYRSDPASPPEPEQTKQ